MKKSLVVLSIITVLFLIYSPRAKGQIINTMAGNGTAAYAGDGGQATAAELYDVVGVAVDDTGNVYIADSHNHAIRKVEASTGVITTIAGTGTGGYNGDGIAATAAQINDPQQIAIDDSGNVFFADYGNEAIRKITVSTGIISTIAGTPTVWSFSGDGGPATAATLSVVTGVAVDDSGNVYIADQWNHRVRKVTKATGDINTIIGTGTYGFNGNGIAATSADLAYPTEISLDDSGNIYFTDSWNNEVRKVTKATGIINDFAGNTTVTTGLGSGGYSGDGGPATAAQLNYPNGMFRDSSGNIYIADWYNQVIRKVTASTGVITTIAGDGFGIGTSNGGFAGDGGPATAAELNAPEGLALDKCGNLYIGDMFNNRVREVIATDSVTVSPNPAIVCSGDSITITASALGTYTWSPATGLSSSTGTTVKASPDTTTTYTVTATSGCAVGTAQVVVTVTPALAVTVQPAAPTLCAGQSVTLIASGGGTYQWVGTTDTTDSLTVSPSKDTTYELLVTSGSCSKDTFIAVKTGGVLAVNIQPQSQTICAGQALTLKATGGYTYNWSPSTGLNTTSGDSVVATPSASVTYTVTAMDTLGCSGTGVDTITVVPVPNVPTISQHGDTLVSSAATDNQWYLNGTAISGATGQYLVIGKSTETYTVAVVNPADGCTSNSAPDITSGINQLSVISGQLSIFPNPTNGTITIDISSSVSDISDWNLRLTDVLGRTIYTRNSLTYSNEVDLSNLAGGVYFITVTNKTGEGVFKVMKQ